MNSAPTKPSVSLQWTLTTAPRGDIPNHEEWFISNMLYQTREVLGSKWSRLSQRGSRVIRFSDLASRPTEINKLMTGVDVRCVFNNENKSYQLVPKIERVTNLKNNGMDDEIKQLEEWYKLVYQLTEQTDDDSLDWDMTIIAPSRNSRRVKVKLKRLGRSKPMLDENI